MKLFVEYENRLIDSERSDEPYSSWSEEHDFRVTGVRTASRKREYEEFEVAFDVEHGTPLFVVWITYTSGDSFGYSTGNGEIIWVFKDSNAALVAMNLWDAASKKHEVAFSVTFDDGEGNKVELSNPVSGYFEDYGSCDIETFLLGV